MYVYILYRSVYTASMNVKNTSEPLHRSLAASLHVTRSGAACAMQNSSLLRIAREQGIELTCYQLQETRAECHGLSQAMGCGSEYFCDTASRILALQHGNSSFKKACTHAFFLFSVAVETYKASVALVESGPSL